jgi:hypothetical protein
MLNLLNKQEQVEEDDINKFVYKMQKLSMKKLWDNKEDDVWDSLLKDKKGRLK